VVSAIEGDFYSFGLPIPEVRVGKLIVSRIKYDDLRV
jgi:hypothetical protein